MFASLRKTLVESHVAAVIVAAMLFYALTGICFAADHLLRSLILFIQLYANHQGYRFSSQLAFHDPYMLSVTLQLVTGAAGAIFCAWLFSRWAYGVGPLRSLAPYREKITRKFHA